MFSRNTSIVVNVLEHAHKQTVFKDAHTCVSNSVLFITIIGEGGNRDLAGRSFYNQRYAFYLYCKYTYLYVHISVQWYTFYLYCKMSIYMNKYLFSGATFFVDMAHHYQWAVLTKLRIWVMANLCL